MKPLKRAAAHTSDRSVWLVERREGIGFVCSSAATTTTTVTKRMPTAAGMKAEAAPRKTVLVTGVSRGLGRALSLELARRGHAVIGCARSIDKVQALQHELMAVSPDASSSSSSASPPSKHLIIDLDVAPYCASKWAVEGLTKSVAKELPPGLAIVALSPGVINTDMLASCFGKKFNRLYILLKEKL
ncbi:hypothetical protein BHE74_00029114 [Ensete ventricosum]|nr:hypothetical protein BHE74_00029114 [Ensete ventricosum]